MSSNRCRHGKFFPFSSFSFEKIFAKGGGEEAEERIKSESRRMFFVRPSCNPGLPAWYYTVQRLPLRHSNTFPKSSWAELFPDTELELKAAIKKWPYFSSSKVFESLRRTFELELSSNPLLPQIPALEWKQSQELCHVSFWEKAREPDVMWRDIRVFQKSLSFPAQRLLFFPPQALLCVPKKHRRPRVSQSCHIIQTSL